MSVFLLFSSLSGFMTFFLCVIMTFAIFYSKSVKSEDDPHGNKAYSAMSLAIIAFALSTIAFHLLA